MRKWYLTRTPYKPHKFFTTLTVGITTVGILRPPSHPHVPTELSPTLQYAILGKSLEIIAEFRNLLIKLKYTQFW